METKHQVQSCGHCGSSEHHQSCPMCSGRGCLSTRELAEKLGLRDQLDAASMTAEAVARAVDKRLLQSVEAVKKDEQRRVSEAIELERQKQATRDAEMRAELQKVRELLNSNSQQLAEERAERKAADARANAAQEMLAKRRSQPAALGRTAERDFAMLIGETGDLRISEKLAKGGDYEIWIRVPDGRGGLAEVAEPLLVDVKLDSAAVHSNSLTKLLRDCKERGRRFGVLVADRLEEVTETFGTPRLKYCQGVIVLFTSVDAVVSDLRLIGMFWSQLVARADGDSGPSSAQLEAQLVDIALIVDDVQRMIEQVAGALDKQADTLRTKIVKKMFGRMKALAGGGGVNGAPRLLAEKTA